METTRKYLARESFRSQAPWLLYTILLASMVFSLRAISSISIGALLLAGLILDPERFKYVLRHRGKRFLLLAGLACLLVELVSIKIAGGDNGGWSNLRTRSALFLVPLTFLLRPPGPRLPALMKMLSLLLVTAALGCLALAVVDYSRNGNSSAFFYHQLVSPISQHAVYISFLVLVALIYLSEKIRTREPVFRGPAGSLVMISLAIFLFLLSSKLMIALLILYGLTFLPRLLLSGRPGLAVGFASVMALTMLFLQSKNPTTERFRDVIHSDLSILNKKSFDPADYFDGIQFRLLHWSFVPEILDKERAWLGGVGSANAQEKLDELYLQKNMYAGEPLSGSRGYLGYNTHNQFLEALLRSGLAGLFMLIILWISLFSIARKNRMGTITALLLFAWSLTESILESQYGLVFFFLPLLFTCNIAREGQPLEGS